MTPIHSIPYSVAQTLEKDSNNYYSIIQGEYFKSWNYGTAAFAFHGRQDCLKEFTAVADKLFVSYFGKARSLAELWADCWNHHKAATVITIFHELFFDNSIDVFLEDLDKLAQVEPEIEIAAMAEFANSVTDCYEYTAFYSPAGSGTIRNPEKDDMGLILYEGLEGEMDNYEGNNGEHAGFDGWGGPLLAPDDDPPDGPDWIYEWQEHVHIHVKWGDADW